MYQYFLLRWYKNYHYAVAMNNTSSNNIGTALDDQDLRTCITLRLGYTFLYQTLAHLHIRKWKWDTHGLSYTQCIRTFTRHVELNRVIQLWNHLFEWSTWVDNIEQSHLNATNGVAATKLACKHKHNHYCNGVRSPKQLLSLLEDF